MSTPKHTLRHRLKQNTPIISPGIYDGLSARIADKSGFELLYLSGYGVSASMLAKPDNGFLTAADMHHRITSICQAVDTPLIADADTGFGDITATVRLYETAGEAGIKLEDQQVTKICGHIPGREVIALDAAVANIACAVAARSNPDFLIVARTDAREQNGLDAAIARGRAFAEAGADIIFIESPESEAEFAAIGAALSDVPLLANMVEGGRSPLLSPAQLADFGFRLIIYPVAAMANVAETLQQAYATLAADGPDGARVDFKTLSRLVGFEQ